MESEWILQNDALLQEVRQMSTMGKKCHIEILRACKAGDLVSGSVRSDCYAQFLIKHFSSHDYI
jgi:hypothetical protein